MKKKRVNRLFLVLFLLIGIGVTIAYFFNTSTFSNIFQAASTPTIITKEKFKSPDSWKPGDTTPKSIITTNVDSDDDICIRAKFDESWVSRNGDTLNGYQVHIYQPYPNSSSIDIVNHAAIINFINKDKWFEGDDGYYYYKYNIAKGESSVSPIESVTFNPLIEPDVTCTESVSGTITTKDCVSSGDGYDGATYTLDITTEAIKCDLKDKIWDPSIYQRYEVVSGSLDTVGSEICISYECFYVIGKEDGKIKLLSKYNLKAGGTYVYNPGGYSTSLIQSYAGEYDYGLQAAHMKAFDYQNSRTRYGAVQFSDGIYWTDGTNGLKSKYGDNYPAYVYDENNELYQTIEDYVTYLTEYGASVTGRLLTLEELYSLDCVNTSCDNAPEWLYHTSFWLGTAKDNYYIYALQNNAYLSSAPPNYNGWYGLRPVILLEP